MSNLTQSEVDEIKADAEKKFPVSLKAIRDIQTESGYVTFDTKKWERDFYIGILTKERQRAKVLQTAAQKVVDEYYSLSNSAGLFADCIKELDQTLNTYNKTQP